MKADFSFYTDGLTLFITDLSIGEISSRTFKVFKDTVEIVSLLDPGLVFEVSLDTIGIYFLELTVVEGEGSSKASQYALVETISSHLEYNTILNIVMTLLPPGVTPNYPQFSIFKTTWMAILGPNFSETPEDETSYSYIQKILVAQLIIRELLLKLASDFLSRAFQTDGSDALGKVKKMVSGPHETEWFDSSETLKGLFSQTGIYNQILNNICSLSLSMGIYLSFCPIAPKDTFTPKLYRYA